MEWPVACMVVSQIVIDVIFAMMLMKFSDDLYRFRRHYIEQEKVLTNWLNLVTKDMDAIDRKVFNDRS